MQGEVGRFVAVVDDLGHSDMDSSQPREDYGRQPPQDMAAEQSVLGGMLLSKDAIADVLERLRPGDFYRPAHQSVYDAVLDLYGRGEPADAVTVSAELDRRGLLKRVGGAPYLHTLISTVPTAANAGYYAGIVAEKALLRRLVEAGTRVVQYGYAGAEGADVAEVVDRAQAEIYDVTDRRTTEDFVPLEQLLQPTMDEIHRSRRSDQRLAPRPDDHHRGQAWCRESVGTRHPACHAVGLDHHGRRRGRRSAHRA
jgi:replicative DNA helicase